VGSLPAGIQAAPDCCGAASPARAGHKAILDGSRPWSESRITHYEWTFTDGKKASGPRVEKAYSKAGTFSEVLKITDDHGRTAYDFETVNVLDSSTRSRALSISPAAPTVLACIANTLDCMEAGPSLAYRVARSTTALTSWN
jgi:hypothetical protein